MINFWPFLISFFVTLSLIPPTILLAKKYGFVDNPKKHKHPARIHSKIIAKAGGLPIYIGILAAAYFTMEPVKQLLGIFLGGLLLVAVGLVDDKRDIKPTYRLIIQFAAALLAVGGGVGIAFITNPLGGVIRLDATRIVFDFFGQHSILVWADLFAVVWIVWVMNMVNFSGGVDGQMPGIVFIAFLVLFFASLRFSLDPAQLIVTKLALAGAGASLAFLIFNFYPAKIFPGDSASFLLGFLVAVSAILAGAKVGAAVLVMSVPLVDGAFTVFRRVVSGQSPFAGDRGHLHHKLMEFGWGQRRIALFYWLFCAILGAAALGLGGAGKVFVAVGISTVILGGIIWLNLTLPIKDQR